MGSFMDATVKGLWVWMVLLFGGCGVSVDVTRDARYPTDYVVGRVYVLQQDCVAHRFDLPEFMNPWDIRPVSDVAENAAAYHANEATFRREGDYLLPSGTRIEYRSMSGWWGLGDAAYASASGRVLDGELAGKTMGISEISIGKLDGGAVPRVDPAFLKPVLEGHGAGG
jgi:hypothetical protein